MSSREGAVLDDYCYKKITLIGTYAKDQSRRLANLKVS